MELALAIIGIGLIVIVTLLYMEARRDVKDYRDQVNSLRKNLDRLNSNKSDLETELSELRRGRSLSDPAATWALTPELVSDALKYNGYKVEDNSEDMCLFKANDLKYELIYNRIPFIQLKAMFSLEDDWNIEVLKKAIESVNPQVFMAKAFVDEKDRSVTNYIDIYEPAYGHFRDCLPDYLTALKAIRNASVSEYDKLIEESNKQQTDVEAYKHVLNDKSVKSTIPS